MHRRSPKGATAHLDVLFVVEFVARPADFGNWQQMARIISMRGEEGTCYVRTRIGLDRVQEIAQRHSGGEFTEEFV